MSSQSAAAAAAMSSTDTKSGIPIMAAPALSTFKVGDKVLVRLKLELLSKNERDKVLVRLKLQLLDKYFQAAMRAMRLQLKTSCTLFSNYAKFLRQEPLLPLPVCTGIQGLACPLPSAG